MNLKRCHAIHLSITESLTSKSALRWSVTTLVLLVALLTLSGCGLFGKDTEAATEPSLVRTPHPTFTPTAAEDTRLAQAPAAAIQQTAPLPAAQVAPAPAGESNSNPPIIQEEPPPALVQDSPRAVVNSPLVNLRAGPSTESEIVATVERGAEYEVTGRSADAEWWTICCVDGQPVWVSASLVDTDGPVDSVAIADAAPDANPQVGGPGGATAPQADAAEQIRFDLEKQEQFPETGFVRIYLYVHTDSGALAGYSLKVTRNGVDLPVSAQSFGGQPAFTWPFQDARQRHQNLKVEFPNEPVSGEWIVRLVDSQSRPVGPPAVFTLRDNDPNQELYVRYLRR